MPSKTCYLRRQILGGLRTLPHFQWNGTDGQLPNTLWNLLPLSSEDVVKKHIRSDAISGSPQGTDKSTVRKIQTRELLFTDDGVLVSHTPADLQFVVNHVTITILLPAWRSCWLGHGYDECDSSPRILWRAVHKWIQTNASTNANATPVCGDIREKEGTQL